MKKVKKLFAVLLVAVMMMTFSTTTFADDETGSITIDNAIKDQTYTIYKILELESYNAATNAYAYKVNDAWSGFFAKAEGDNPAGAGLAYVDIDAQGYVTWKKAADVAAFAKDAQKYAKDNGIVCQREAKANSDNENIKFENLELGYYLLDSSMGTLCSLDTTNPDVTIKEKNQAPENEKKVIENSTGNIGSVNDAEIGQTVEFQSTIIAQAGAENYVFHDKMSAGLTFGSVTDIKLNDNVVNAENYEVKTSDLESTDPCTFHVVFTQAFCDSLKADDKIVISYTAKVNEEAVVGSDGNKNESKLEYGESGKTTTTPPSETITYTWSFDVLKYANENKADVLKDAKFVLLNKEKNKVASIADGKFNKWTDIPEGENNSPQNYGTVLITGDDGKIAISGLDAGTYYLKEVEAPKGYNKLAEEVKVVINPTENEDGTLSLAQVTVEISNKSGDELPSTGGMGTNIFYVVGSILVIGAAILLITKKRMNTEK